MSRQSVIETERLILRPFTPDDAADVYDRAVQGQGAQGVAGED